MAVHIAQVESFVEEPAVHARDETEQSILRRWHRPSALKPSLP